MLRGRKWQENNGRNGDTTFEVRPQRTVPLICLRTIQGPTISLLIYFPSDKARQIAAYLNKCADQIEGVK